MIGAAPDGTGDPQAAARAVREMFTAIAPRYDLLNHLLSFNVDRLWWRKTARRFAGVLSRPEGECGILDFAEPRGMVGKVYRIYFKRVLPGLGTVISGVRGPYAYLPSSVERFPEPAEMLERMRVAGFREVSWTPYTLGIAGLYRGVKSS